jgi:hypothetical protein
VIEEELQEGESNEADGLKISEWSEDVSNNEYMVE